MSGSLSLPPVHSHCEVSGRIGPVTGLGRIWLALIDFDHNFLQLNSASPIIASFTGVFHSGKSFLRFASKR